MPKVSIYVPEDLYEQGMAQGLNFSATCQAGLHAQLEVEPRPHEALVMRMFRGLQSLVGGESAAAS